MIIEELYANDEFNDYLVFLAGKNYLEYDDFKQDVFLEMLDGEKVKTMNDAKRIARRIKERMKKKNMGDYHYSLSVFDDSYEDDNNGILWEEVNQI